MAENFACVPPLVIEAIIVQYHFEGGGYIALVCAGRQSTIERLDAIQKMIDIKRKEVVDIADKVLPTHEDVRGILKSE
jgi:hypothetical protein